MEYRRLDIMCGGKVIPIHLNYSKEENLLLDQFTKFDWLISTSEKFEGRHSAYCSNEILETCNIARDHLKQNFELVETIDAFEKITFSLPDLKKLKWPISVKLSKSLVILRNKHFRKNE